MDTIHSCSRRCIVFSLVCWLVVMCTGCKSAILDGADIEVDKDAILVAAVKKAVAEGVGPEEIEKAVGIPAAYNTTTKKGRHDMVFEHIAADEAHNEKIPDLRQARHVVYWVRPGIFNIAGDLKIIGVVWADDGRVLLFWGMLYL